MKKTTLFLVILTLLHILLPNVNFGQVPNLRTASGFLLFTTTGALGNTGVSDISGGAIGTNNGAITNFGNVNCPQHVQDAATAQCAIDLQAAFNEIHAIPVTQTIPAELSGTFIPGVYHINSAATLTNTVILDAQNIPGAQFIFNVTGAFWAAANAKILLLNSASVNNIFWNVDGAVGAGAGASLKGTFLALAGAIDFGEGTLLEGRALTIVGAVSINNTTIMRCLLPSAPSTDLIQPTCSIATGTITITAPLEVGLTYSIDGITFTNTTGIFSQVLEGNYTVTVKNPDGCISTSEVTIAGIAHAPNLGAVRDFILFTSVGAIGNTGTATTIIGGAIGTNLGPITGFGSVACAQHIEDGATAQCALDLQAVFNEIHNMPVTHTIPSADLPLAGTYTAGVYLINSAVTLTTALTLDAQNNPDALFVFNVTGAFWAASSAQILLINGASANNIFWNVDGAVGMGALASLKGTFISIAGAIDFGDGSSLEGRALTIAGAVNIYNSNLSTCESPPAPILTVTQPTCLNPEGAIEITAPTGTGMTYRIDNCVYTNTSGIFTNLSAGTYYVSVKNVFGCISPATIVTIDIAQTLLTWSGSNSTEWNNPSNWVQGIIPAACNDVIIPVNAVVVMNALTPAICNNLTIGSGACLTIESGKKLTVSGTLLNNAGINGLIVKSNSSGSGSLINNSVGVNARIEHYMNGSSWAWHFLSSPVTSQSISGSFTPSGAGNNFDFYTWHEPSLLWVNFKNTTLTPTWNNANGSTFFLPASGYLVAYEAISTQLEFSGQLNSGPVVYPLTMSGLSTYQYFNLAGNPFPCSIDWKAETGWTRDKLEGTDKSFWIWNDAAGNYGAYSSATSGDAGTNGVTRYIAPGQGYFVEAAESGQLTMDNAIKVHSSQSYLKDGEINIEELKIKLTSVANAYSDETIIAFNNSNPEDGSAKYNSMYADAPEIWTVKNGSHYSINFSGNLNTEMIVPLGIKAGTAGDFILTASQVESFGSGNVRLEDRTKGTFTNLRITPQYKFHVAEPSILAERFFLHFPDALSLSNNESVKGYTVHTADGKILIYSMRKSDGKINVTDMAGRTIATGNIQAGATIYINMGGRTGIYIVSIINSNSVNNRYIRRESFRVVL